MKLKLIPQSIAGGAGPEYSADGDVLTVVYGDKTDTFDFSDMPDDSLSTDIVSDILDGGGNPIRFVLSAERVSGELSVTAVWQYPPGAPDEEAQEREVVI